MTIPTPKQLALDAWNAGRATRGGSAHPDLMTFSEWWNQLPGPLRNPMPVAGASQRTEYRVIDPGPFNHGDAVELGPRILTGDHLSSVHGLHALRAVELIAGAVVSAGRVPTIESRTVIETPWRSGDQ